MNKDTKLNKFKFILYPFISYLYCWLLITIVLFLFHNIVEYNSCIILCDSAGSSTEQFFVDDSQSNSNNRNERPFTDSDSLHTDAYCSHLLDKYKKKGKRRISWFIFEKGKGNYASYVEYKKSWDPNFKIFGEIKKQFKSDVQNNSHKLNVAKRTFSWFFRGSKPGGGRGL